MAKVETEYERTLKQRAELKEIGDKQLALEAELGLPDAHRRARRLPPFARHRSLRRLIHHELHHEALTHVVRAFR
jgi:hypothetical protein